MSLWEVGFDHVVIQTFLKVFQRKYRCLLSYEQISQCFVTSTTHYKLTKVMPCLPLVKGFFFRSGKLRGLLHSLLRVNN